MSGAVSPPRTRAPLATKHDAGADAVARRVPRARLKPPEAANHHFTARGPHPRTPVYRTTGSCPTRSKDAYVSSPNAISGTQAAQRRQWLKRKLCEKNRQRPVGSESQRASQALGHAAKCFAVKLVVTFQSISPLPRQHFTAGFAPSGWESRR